MVLFPLVTYNAPSSSTSCTELAAEFWARHLVVDPNLHQHRYIPGSTRLNIQLPDLQLMDLPINLPLPGFGNNTCGTSNARCWSAPVTLLKPPLSFFGPRIFQWARLQAIFSKRLCIPDQLDLYESYLIIHNDHHRAPMWLLTSLHWRLHSQLCRAIWQSTI
jgi:hypothetical protein